MVSCPNEQILWVTYLELTKGNMVYNLQQRAERCHTRDTVTKSLARFGVTQIVPTQSAA